MIHFILFSHGDTQEDSSATVRGRQAIVQTDDIFGCYPYSADFLKACIMQESWGHEGFHSDFKERPVRPGNVSLKGKCCECKAEDAGENLKSQRYQNCRRSAEENCT